MLRRLFGSTSELQSVFEGHYIDVKAYYAYRFNAMCNLSFIGDLDASAAHEYLVARFKMEFVDIYQHSYFEHAAGELLFNNTIYVLNGKRMIEMGSNYCQVLCRPGQNKWMRELMTSLADFKISVYRHEPVIGFAVQHTQN